MPKLEREGIQSDLPVDGRLRALVQRREQYVYGLFPSQNPYTGPYADTAPPIMGGAGYTKVTVVPADARSLMYWIRW